MSMIETIAKFALTQSMSLIIARPFEALGAGIALSNPYTRGIVFDITLYFAKNQIRDIRFVSGTLYNRVAIPAAQASRQAAIRFATTPATAIPAAAIGAAAVGAAISAGTVVMINRDQKVDTSSGVSMWSPFGGMGFGTVV